jgi:glycosyltransferase involved in cell wall biosynthesis
MKTSMIVATYNRPQYLRLCVQSLAASTVRPSEVLIADDGSTQETIDTVLELQKSFERVFPILHVRQAHEGCRKQKIVNEAVRRSSGDYLIFTDGDCMVHKDCIDTHMKRSDPNAILAGQRVQIGKELTEKLLVNGTVVNGLSLELMIDFFKRKSHHSKESLVIKNTLLRRLLKKDRIKNETTVIGCNCSLYKQLFMDINGYDEDFLGFGDEDADIGVRIINQGKSIKSVRNLAIVYHLYHPGTWDMTTEQFKYNALLKKKRIENRETVCKNGIRQIQ